MGMGKMLQESNAQHPIPVNQVAIEMGEAHPDFDWLGAKNHTRDSAEYFSRCV